ncbi:hypothetical protein ACFL0H_00045 [Thermodesulfobacteriota bacterium]
MGGIGSGRPSGFAKTTVEECRCLTTQVFVRQKLLSPGIHVTDTLNWKSILSRRLEASCNIEINTLDLDSAWIRLCHTYPYSDEGIDYKIRLETTRPNLGGIRWWFNCPINDCNRRAAKLYRPPLAKLFGCRHCHDLTYRSCQNSHKSDSLFGGSGKTSWTTSKEIRRIMIERSKITGLAVL